MSVGHCVANNGQAEKVKELKCILFGVVLVCV